ncbi:hypothetical protein AGMMS50262_19830 [Bacteroidia bacterium]|nr:hypothetical protein AGMMS50262_19830 [Bacteroidia bacterium]
MLPVAHAEEVTSLISDSGITRYRMQTAVWDIYTGDTLSYWYFPEGVYLEKFDSIFTVEGSIKADTAYYFQEKDLWRLVGNVKIQNLAGYRFETDELFWNKKEPPFSKNAIYTDKFVRIENGDRIVTSIGLRSNQDMTDYTLYFNTVETVVNDNPPPND